MEYQIIQPTYWTLPNSKGIPARNESNTDQEIYYPVAVGPLRTQDSMVIWLENAFQETKPNPGMDSLAMARVAGNVWSIG